MQLPPELETLTAVQVALSFGRKRDWWSRVRKRYEEELRFPKPLAPLTDRRKGFQPATPMLVYNKQAVIEWHRRNGAFGDRGGGAEVPAPVFDVAALGAAR